VASGEGLRQSGLRQSGLRDINAQVELQSGPLKGPAALLHGAADAERRRDGGDDVPLHRRPRRVLRQAPRHEHHPGRDQRRRELRTDA